MAIIVVEDGRTPRTAGLLAYLTKWSCYWSSPIIVEGGDAIGAFGDRIYCGDTSHEDARYAIGDAEFLVGVFVNQPVSRLVARHISSDTMLQMMSVVQIGCDCDYVSFAPSVCSVDPCIWSRRDCVAVWGDTYFNA